MQDYQRSFVEFAIGHDVLRFGSFTLKSGRTSPYFFNAGGFDTGARLAGLGRFYAAAIAERAPDFDVLLGPAYKGIPIAAATAVQLAEHHGRDVPWSFNRKEAKDHGEGGMIVGAPLQGRVLLVDDVITSGKAIREVVPLVEDAGAELAGIVVAVDRQERGSGDLSAVDEVRRDLAVPVEAIVTFDHVIEFLEESGRHGEHLDAARAYRDQYGA
ncbi:orotate phosphoribosyltransferase [Aeromicrobium sp. 50.2.37]|uniref:orotate phosphoribosyltransferase n=1 Tax=Aeromicrobium sp. 50.2.37 TaxID=2969305 RepID=UPI0021502731|nr:orotate phosphoribosyltransferase [Aeromicrobium sp. 50.2.37]MCR4513614.1 orotate phosphoribosyltransferase [Aeromicrobium sp. 50.2.37]